MANNVRPTKPVKLPPPRYHYKLITVEGSPAACRMESALREQLTGVRLSFFSTCRRDCATYQVMGDSGASPLDEDSLKRARLLAAEIKEAGR